MSSNHRCCWPTADPCVAPLRVALFRRGDEMARQPVPDVAREKPWLGQVRLLSGPI